MKKILLILFMLSFTSCASISEKAGKLKPNIGSCPEKSERKLSDILCKESK